MSELDSTGVAASVPQQRSGSPVPGQAAPGAPGLAPGQPVPDVVREFQLVHAAMRQAAHVLVQSSERLRPGPTPRSKELSRYIGCLVVFVHHHHTGEDEHWWPSLAERSAAAGQVLAPLTDDHAELDPLLDALRGHAEQLAAGTHDVAVVRRDAQALRDHLVEHLQAEEPVLFPLLAAHLDDAEAARLGRLMAQSAPRTGLSYLLGAMDAAATPEQQQVVLSTMPLPIRLLRPLLLRSYRRRLAVLVPS